MTTDADASSPVPARHPLLRRLGMPQFGALPVGLAAERIVSSRNFENGVAQNLVPTTTGSVSTMAPLAAEYITSRAERVPKIEIPVVKPDLDAATLNAADARVTWLGHSTTLLNVDGTVILTDPVFSKRASPFQWSGPARFHPVPIGLADLPELDAVLISHDHYDHLDFDTIRFFAKRGTKFVTALGVGAHLKSWGVDEKNITELDWWEHAAVGNLEIHATPARHFSGRASAGGNQALWASWAFIGPKSKVWFSGDTGFFESVKEIGDRFGGFDLTLIEAGAHHPAWDDVHLGPRRALKMHQLVGGTTWMPVHWGTFNLALHAWDEPIVAAQQHADEAGVELLAPLAGQTVEASAPVVADLWQQRRHLSERDGDTAPSL